jgi:4-hydroxybenzoate polyprenyltransferase
LISVGLLWFYSTAYKKAFIIGNFVVALLSGFVPIVVGFYEPNRANINFYFVLGYAIFAFMISMVREIIKDIEDIDGDKEFNCKTMPIVAGVTLSKIVAFVIGLLLAVMIGYLEYMQYLSHDKVSFWYFSLAIQAPLLFLLYKIITAKVKADFSSASLWAKTIMVTGVLSMVIFYLSF